jgi:hypothetical protein
MYQSSLSLSESHSLGPLVLFFCQLAKASHQISDIILDGGVMDFLLHVYISNFLDPLATVEPVDWCENPTIQGLCDSLLITCSKTDMGRNIRSGPFNSLWWMEKLDLPRMELQSRLAERAEMWKSIKPESISWRIQLIFNMDPAIWRMPVDEQGPLTARISRILLVTDLMEFMG